MCKGARQFPRLSERRSEGGMKKGDVDGRSTLVDAKTFLSAPIGDYGVDITNVSVYPASNHRPFYMENNRC